MKRVIRRGVFETNSSSTHSLTFCSKEEYEAWESSVFLFDGDRRKFVSKEEAVKRVKELEKEFGYKPADEETIDELLGEYSFYTNKEYFSSNYLIPFVEHYTTPKGEEIVAFGKYGND